MGDVRYIADSTRPDITFVFGRLRAAMATPTVSHWNVMKETLVYLHKTRNHGPHFRRKQHQNEIHSTSAKKPLTSFPDSDWENEKVDRRSVAGGFFTWFGKPLGWHSKNQSVVATSTSEAEYRAIIEFVQRAIFAQTLATSFTKERPHIAL